VTYPPDPLPLRIIKGRGECSERGLRPLSKNLFPSLVREGDKGGGLLSKYLGGEVCGY
jgi:hypothetical protein